MPPKKVSRKKLLKEPDEFISTTGKVLQFLREHQRQVTTLALIAIAVLIAGAGAYYYLLWQEGKAQAVQQQALQLYQEALSASADPDKEKESYKRAREKFQEALSFFSRSRVSQVSQIYIGHSHYALKEYDQAIQAYSRCLAGFFRPMALDGLAYCYEAKGDFSQALEQYLKGIEEESNPLRGEALVGAARCYEALNQKPKALEYYQKALAKSPKSRLVEYMQKKINELTG